MDWQNILKRPIIREAIESHGEDPERVAQKIEQAGSQGQSASYNSDPFDFTKPYIAIDDQGGIVDWGKHGVALQINKKAETDFTFLITLSQVRIPESLLATLNGRNLNELVDIPGAEFYRIKQSSKAVMMKAAQTMGKVYSQNSTQDSIEVHTIEIEAKATGADKCEK